MRRRQLQCYANIAARRGEVYRWLTRFLCYASSPFSSSVSSCSSSKFSNSSGSDADTSDSDSEFRTFSGVDSKVWNSHAGKTTRIYRGNRNKRKSDRSNRKGKYIFQRVIASILITHYRYMINVYEWRRTVGDEASSSELHHFSANARVNKS